MNSTCNKGKTAILVTLFSVKGGNPIQGLLVKVTEKSYVIQLTEEISVLFNRADGKSNKLKSKSVKDYFVDCSIIEQSLRIVEGVESVGFLDYEFIPKSKDSRVPIFDSTYSNISDWALSMGMVIYDSERVR